MAITPVLIPEKRPGGLAKFGQMAQAAGTIGTMTGQPWGPVAAGAGSLIGMAQNQGAQIQPAQTFDTVPQQAPNTDTSVAMRMKKIDPQIVLNDALLELDVLDLPEEQKNIYRQPLLQAYQKGGFA